MTWTGKYAKTLYPIIQANDIPIMQNAFHRYSEVNGFLDPIHAPTHGDLIIDSGGFNALQHGYTEFPYSVAEYHTWLSNLDVDFQWAAAMDYACEHRFDTVMSKQERMERTLTNTITHFELDPEYTVLPILQGRTLDDYLWFYDQLQDHGIPTGYVGLGTVCRLNSESKIKDIERGIRANTDIEKLHGFGIKINAFKTGACFETADSNAWNMEPTNGNVVFDDGDRLQVECRNESGQAARRSIRSFMEYYKYASRLRETAAANRKGTQVSLQSFGTQA